MEENLIESFFKGTILEKGYGYISRTIMRNKAISRDAKALYSYLISFAGNKMEAFPGWKTICEELGFKSKDTYYKYMNELKEHGLLKVDQQTVKGKWSKNIYTLALRDEQIEEFKSLPKKQESDTVSEKAGIVKSGNRFFSESNINISLNNNNILNKEEEETIKPIIKSYYEARGKVVSPTEKKVLYKLYTDTSMDIVLKAIEIMAELADKPSTSYLKSTLKDWENKGLNTIEKINLSLTERKESNKKLRDDKRKNIKSIINSKNKISTFNNYTQRPYDGSDGQPSMNEIERKLLGWDNTEN